MFSLDDDHYRVRISILGYQYHDPSLHFYDLQWLRVRAEVETDRFSFGREDPSVMTLQLKQYIAWLQAWAENAPGADGVFPFWDQTLRFHVERQGAESTCLTVVLAYGLLDEARVPPDCLEDQELRLTFPDTSPRLLGLLADEARDALTRFPIRGRHPDHNPNATRQT